MSSVFGGSGIALALAKHLRSSPPCLGFLSLKLVESQFNSSMWFFRSCRSLLWPKSLQEMYQAISLSAPNLLVSNKVKHEIFPTSHKKTKSKNTHTDPINIASVDLTRYVDMGQCAYCASFTSSLLDLN
jgi:hypothetical protein